MSQPENSHIPHGRTCHMFVQEDARAGKPLCGVENNLFHLLTVGSLSISTALN